MRALIYGRYTIKKRFLLLPFLTLIFLLASFATESDVQSADGEFVVVLDAGHGGHDPGNLGNGYLEKNIALSIVLKAGAILEQTPGIKVVYTRNDDTFVDLYVRGEIANKANADLFVSVHCDSHTSNAHGAGTFVLGLHANKQNFEIAKKENSVIYLEDNYESRYADYDINSPESVIGLTIMQEEFLDQSISLAKTIQTNFSNKLKRKDREVKQAGFIVLHQTFMPSVLVETGFLTNDSEGAYLNSKKGQSEMGTAIADAIVNYQGGYQPGVAEASKTVSSPVPDPEKEVVVENKVAKAEKEVVVEKKVSDANTMTSEDTAAEQFAKNPGANPIADKPTVVQPKVKEVVESAGEAAITSVEKETGKAPVVVEQAAEEAEKMVAKPEPVEETPVKQEVVLASEQSKPLEVAKEEAPKSVVTAEKEVVKKEEVVEPAKPKGNDKNIIFKVQLMASTKDIPLESDRFGGLDELSKERFNAFRRYLYGNTDSFAQAKLLKSLADANGYPTSFIVAYKDGVRIPTPDAIKLVSE